LRSKLGDKDEKDADLISAVFFERKEKVGIRQIKMLIEKHCKTVMNKKKIARIKRKYGLVTQIRRRNKYAQFAKIAHEHKSCPNFLNRDFNQVKADEVYSTDITQLNYGKGSKAYLAIFKDLATKEIVSRSVSKRIDLRLVNSALDKALEKLPKVKRKRLMIHSDQGFHFTHISYRKRLDENEVIQSMSRKGNCIDNAPAESFFGYIKDHLELKECFSFEELEEMVTKEIDYYNYDRPQEGLKKMPPMTYRRHLNL
jgi:transposase InsO family protein